jgi:RHS repeat-associated protein
LYPFKWYSVASSTGTGAKYATTTDYVFNSDTLLATVDQQTASGVATGTAKTRYVHPDHLGSTNVVTDENDNVVQTLDYYPYGATRISVATSTNEKRKYIGQFSDDSGLSYLNARYMDPSRGQFPSEEPIFLNLGDPNQVKQLAQQEQQTYLSDPQALNSYSYGRDNPITRKDLNGKQAVPAVGVLVAPELAPVLVPAAIITTAVVGTYYATDYLLKNSGNGWGSRWGGTVPTLDPATMGFGSPPSGFEDWQPNLGGKPPWMKIAAIGTFGTIIGAEFAKPLYELYTSLTTRGPQAQQALNQQLNSSSVQTRQQATQAYNAATGASTPQQQLWVTPNGAVINWAGQVIAPAPSNSSNNKK